jgi:hypothetical protein
LFGGCLPISIKRFTLKKNQTYPSSTPILKLLGLHLSITLNWQALYKEDLSDERNGVHKFYCPTSDELLNQPSLGKG